jgi:hypothetical protein
LLLFGAESLVFQFEDPGVDGRIILKCIFKRLDGGGRPSIGLRIGTGGWLL